MTHDSDSLDSDRLEQCMELFAVHQRRLFMYINAMLPSPADADEVLQETNIVIWKKFDQFDPDAPGSDFLSWAYRIAFFQVRDYRRRSSRTMLTFSPEVLDQLAGAISSQQTVLEHRRLALATCLSKLADEDRDLIQQCYAPNAKVQRIAAKMKRKATSVYRSLRRIRQLLFECATAALATNE